MPKLEKLRTTHLRVLKALGDGAVLTRARLALASGFSEISGSTTRALNGVRAGSSDPNGQTGVIELGWVEKIELDLDGLVESCYRITEAGRRVLADNLTEAERMDKVRGAKVCTNKRYEP